MALKTFTHGPFSVSARCGNGMTCAVCRIDGSKVTIINFRTWQSDAEIDVRDLEREDTTGATYAVLKADRS